MNLRETIRIKTDAFSKFHFYQDKCINSRSAEIIFLVITGRSNPPVEIHHRRNYIWSPALPANKGFLPGNKYCSSIPWIPSHIKKLTPGQDTLCMKKSVIITAQMLQHLSVPDSGKSVPAQIPSYSGFQISLMKMRDFCKAKHTKFHPMYQANFSIFGWAFIRALKFLSFTIKKFMHPLL